MTEEEIKQSITLLSKFEGSKVDKLRFISASLCGLLTHCEDQKEIDEVLENLSVPDKVEANVYARGMWWYAVNNILKINPNRISKMMAVDYNTVIKSIARFNLCLKDPFTKERYSILKQHFEKQTKNVLPNK